jgi:hypothetical protein
LKRRSKDRQAMNRNSRCFWIQPSKIIEGLPSVAPALLGDLWGYPLRDYEVKYFVEWVCRSSKRWAPFEKKPFTEERTGLPAVILISDSAEFMFMPAEIGAANRNIPRGLYVFSGTSGYPSTGTLNELRRITEYVRFEEFEPVTLPSAQKELVRIGQEAQAEGRTISLFPFGLRDGQKVFDPTFQEFAGEVLAVTHIDGRVETTIFGPLPRRPGWDPPIDTPSNPR